MIEIREINELKRTIDALTQSISSTNTFQFTDNGTSKMVQRATFHIYNIQTLMSAVKEVPDSEKLEWLIAVFENIRKLRRLRNFKNIIGNNPFFWHRPSLKKPSFIPKDPISIMDAILIVENRTGQIIAHAERQKLHNKSAIDSLRDIAPELRKILPDQTPAPVKFDIVKDKIVILDIADYVHPDDQRNVNNSWHFLTNEGTRLIEALERTNCDPRNLECLRRLQTAISRQDNVIAIGLITMTVENVFENSADVPDVLIGEIKGYTAGVSMHLAQFRDWQIFTEHALNIEFTHSDIEHIGLSAQAAIDKIVNSPEIADEEVPKTLKWLRDLISDPTRTTKRAAFAVLRTVENLVAKIYQYGAELFDKTLTKSIERVSGGISNFVAGSVLAVALAASAALVDLNTKFPETKWMKAASEIVEKQFYKILNQ